MVNQSREEIFKDFQLDVGKQSQDCAEDLMRELELMKGNLITP